MGGGPELFVLVMLGAVMVCVGVPLLGGAAYFLTAGVKNGRRKVVITASLLPVVCVVWGASVLWVEGSINQNWLNRDAGYGDMWACPLPNGYALMMIDDPDVGVLYNTKTQTLKSGVAWGTGFDDTIGGVRTLQVEGPYIFGGANSHLYDPRTGTKWTPTSCLMRVQANMQVSQPTTHSVTQHSNWDLD